MKPRKIRPGGWYKNISIRIPITDYIVCATCKKKVSSRLLKQKVVLKKDGSYAVKGSCPVCRQFAKWIPKTESKWPNL